MENLSENPELTNRPEPEHVVPKKNDVFGFNEDDTEQKELEFKHWIYGSMAQKKRDTDRRLSASTKQLSLTPALTDVTHYLKNSKR